MLLQTERTECALACLAMVAGYWGPRCDLRALRQRFPLSLNGVNLRQLLDVAQRLGFSSRPLKLDLPQLAQLRLPCLLHWDFNHFVVLRSVARGRAVIHDPAAGVRRMSLAQLGQHFSGVALELQPGPDFAVPPASPAFGLRQLFGRVQGLAGHLWQLLLLGVALQTCVLVAPFHLQWVVDEALLAGDRNLLAVLGLGFALLLLLQVALNAARSWTLAVLATSLNYQWLGNLFARLLRLPLGWFEKRHLGDIASRLAAVQIIQRSLGPQLLEGMIDGMLAVATLCVLLLYSPTLAVLVVGITALYALLRLSLYGAQRRAGAEQLVHAARQQSQLLESIRGIQTLKLAERTEERRAAWLNTLADQFSAELRSSRLSVWHQAGHLLLSGTQRIAVIWLAALAVIEARFSVGMLYAFISYQDQFSQRAAGLIDRLLELRLLRLQAERVADILLSEPEPVAPEFPQAPDSTGCELELRNLWFRYGEGEPWILQDVSLRVREGESLVITGASGCGKTTLLKVLLGLHAPTRGEILVGGVPLSRLGLPAWRHMIGVVMQEDRLFAGSIADNICFFDHAPEMALITECARMAAIDAEIAALPMGYQTPVGDIGGGLSGGQAQRVMLARALYRRPRLLVLDEATNQLDLPNERRVTGLLDTLPLTRLVVAHRPETIARAGRVMVLAGGRIASDERRSDPVDEHEQTQPHHVDEVPVPGHGFKAEMARGREVALHGAEPDYRQHDGPDGHVQSVEARQHEEG